MDNIIINNNNELKNFLIDEILPLFNGEDWEWADMLKIPELLETNEQDEYLFEEFPEIEELKKMNLTFKSIDTTEYPILINYCIGESFDRLGTSIYRILNVTPLNQVRGYLK